MNTPTWQFSILPSRPHHCRATPTELAPFLAKAEGSNTITPSGSPNSAPTWVARTLSKGASAHGTCPMNFWSPWRC